MNRTLGTIIKNYRLTNKLSLREFARKCDVSHTYIDKLEKGFDPRSGKPIEPTLLVIEKISSAMNKSNKTLLEELDFIEKDNSGMNNQELDPWLEDIRNTTPQKREELKRFWEFIAQKYDS